MGADSRAGPSVRLDADRAPSLSATGCDAGASLLDSTDFEGDFVALPRFRGAFAAPPALAGLLEVRGIGVVRLAHRERSFVALVAELDPSATIERMPSLHGVEILGLAVAAITLRAFEASSAAKLRLVARGLDLHSDAAPTPQRRRWPT